MDTPRADAASSGSRISMAPPSPRLVPFRSRLNGQASVRRHHTHRFPGFQETETERCFAPSCNGQLRLAPRTIQNALQELARFRIGYFCNGDVTTWQRLCQQFNQKWTALPDVF